MDPVNQYLNGNKPPPPQNPVGKTSRFFRMEEEVEEAIINKFHDYCKHHTRINISELILSNIRNKHIKAFNFKKKRTIVIYCCLLIYGYCVGYINQII